MLTDPATLFSLASPLAGALTRAALAIGRLDHALDGNPLLPAILFRTRLDAVRLQAAADGHAIDQWRLAGLIEGLRPSLDGPETIAERGQIFEAARQALALHDWLATPDFDQEGEIKAAEAALSREGASSPLLAAGVALHRWIDANQARAPMRAALPRFWRASRVLRAPVPLTAARALGADAPWRLDEWLPYFLDALADEADEMAQAIRDLHHGWRAARSAVIGRRRSSRAPDMVDLLAAAPLLSSATAAQALAIAPKNAIRLLTELQAAGAAIEITRREKRRLYALPGLAPLRAAIAAPRRPELGRGRGRPQVQHDTAGDEADQSPPIAPQAAPLPPFRFDYGNLDEAMAALDDTIRRTKGAINRLLDHQTAAN